MGRHSLLRRAARMSVEACTLGREKAELLALHRDRRSGLTNPALSVPLSLALSTEHLSI